MPGQYFLGVFRRMLCVAVVQQRLYGIEMVCYIVPHAAHRFILLRKGGVMLLFRIYLLQQQGIGGPELRPLGYAPHGVVQSHV